MNGEHRISYMSVFSAAIYPVMGLPRGQGNIGCSDPAADGTVHAFYLIQCIGEV